MWFGEKLLSKTLNKLFHLNPSAHVNNSENDFNEERKEMNKTKRTTFQYAREKNESPLPLYHKIKDFSVASLKISGRFYFTIRNYEIITVKTVDCL